MSVPRLHAPRLHAPRFRPGSKGFTLVELMVVIAIIGAIIALVLPTLMRSKATAHATLCQKHLKELFQQIDLYKMERGYYPNDSGIRFLIAPWDKKVVENDPKNAKVYVCPADEHVMQEIEGDYSLIAEELEDIENFPSELISYAGRNQDDYPLDFNNRASQAIASDDDEFGLNHPNQINVLYFSGDTDKILLEKLEGEELVIGEESALEVLRVLSSE